MRFANHFTLFSLLHFSQLLNFYFEIWADVGFGGLCHTLCLKGGNKD